MGRIATLGGLGFIALATSGTCLAADAPAQPDLNTMYLHLSRIQDLSAQLKKSNLDAHQNAGNLNNLKAPPPQIPAVAQPGAETPAPAVPAAADAAAASASSQVAAQQSDEAKKTLSDADALYKSTIQVCYKKIQDGQTSIAEGQRHEDNAKITGLSFTTAGVISTFHPVAAGLTAIGTLIAADNKSVAGVFSDNVASATAQYNAYQKSVADAQSKYWTDYEASLTMDGGVYGEASIAKRIEALSKLADACNMLGIAYAPSTTNPAPSPTPNPAQPSPAN